jgi:hypothetical protein
MNSIKSKKTEDIKNFNIGLIPKKNRGRPKGSLTKTKEDKKEEKSNNTVKLEDGKFIIEF